MGYNIPLKVAKWHVGAQHTSQVYGAHHHSKQPSPLVREAAKQQAPCHTSSGCSSLCRMAHGSLCFTCVTLCDRMLQPYMQHELDHHTYSCSCRTTSLIMLRLCSSATPDITLPHRVISVLALPAAPLQFPKALLNGDVARQVAPVLGHTLGSKGALLQSRCFCLQLQLLPLQRGRLAQSVLQ